MIFLFSVLAQIGKITPPAYMGNGVANDGTITGPIGLLNSILRIIFIAAGIWVFFNIILAGFKFLNAGGDPKAVAAAWDKITKSVIGLAVIVSSFLVAAIIGLIIFKDPTIILNPKLNTP